MNKLYWFRVLQVLPTFQIHFLDGNLSHSYSGKYLLISQCLFAKVNISGMRRPSMCGTSMIFTLSHAMYFDVRSITYKFVSSKNISYEVSILLLHRRQVHSSHCCQDLIHFSFCSALQCHFANVNGAQLLFFHKYV